MDTEIFYQTIGNTLSTEWGESSSNKLSLTCLYSLNIFSNNDFIYWNTAQVLKNILQERATGHSISETNFHKFISAIYCILASNQTVYSLPSMLNLKWRNGKITPHILFGESLSNLAAISLLSESHRLLLGINETNNKIELIKVFNKEIIEFRNKSQAIKHFGDISKEILEADYVTFRHTLLINTIVSLLVLYNYPSPDRKEISLVVDKLLAHPTIPDNGLVENILKNSSFLKSL